MDKCPGQIWLLAWSIKKDKNNAVADALSQVTAHLELEAVQAILDGATMLVLPKEQRERT